MARWFVIIVEKGCDFRAGPALDALGFETFCPTATVETLHHRTKAKIIQHVPLFPGYLFLRLSRFDWDRIRTVPGVKSVIRDRSSRLPMPCDPDLVDAIQEAMYTGKYDAMNRRPGKFMKGDLVTYWHRNRRLVLAMIDEIIEGFGARLYYSIDGSRRLTQARRGEFWAV